MGLTSVTSYKAALYGTNLLFRPSPDVEIYSIDEAFVDLSWLSGDELRKYALAIRSTVMQWTGIPISVGIAPTKTLAKIANRVAKKQSQHHGIFIYPQSELEREAVLKAIAVENIWGIGRQYSSWLHSLDITEALSLKNTPIAEGNSPLHAMSAASRLRLIQQKMGIVGIGLLIATEKFWSLRKNKVLKPLLIKDFDFRSKIVWRSLLKKMSIL